MNRASIAALAVVICLAGCGSMGGAKTALSQEQFAEVKVNCKLDGATFGPANSTTTTTNPDGSTSTVTIEHEGAPDQTMISLRSGVPEDEAALALICLKGEFDRLGAEARLELPADIQL